MRPSDRRAASLGEGAGGAESFTGGMRIGWYTATQPLVTLTLYAEGLSMEAGGSRGWLRRAVPVWQARYDELADVQAVGTTPPIATGIRFRTASTGEWAVFWTAERPRVLQALSAHGVVVRDEPIRFRYTDPGR
jgi:hypothetical protein